MANDFLIKIKAVLDNQVSQGITQINKELEQTGAKISNIKISKDLATGAQIINTTLKPMGDNAGVAAAKMGDLQKALNRVAVVAPVWMAFRSVMMSFFSGISEGFKLMEEFDRAMLKAQSVIMGVSRDVGESTKILADRIRNLSQSTGESMTNITEAFYRFAEVGTPFEEAWKGAEASVGFARATMGNTIDTASTMALVMRLLGKTVDETIPPNKALEVQMAKMFKLWQVNAFEANQLTDSFKAFLPTANTMGFTIDQTTALLATLNSAAMQGSRGGTLLRTSMTKLLQNLNELANSLGISVNPQLDTTFTVLMKVLGVIKSLNTGGGISTQAESVLTNIFGGVRGAEPIRGLVALYDLLNSNLAVTTTKYNELGNVLSDYAKRQEDVTNAVSTQLQIFRQLRTQVFETFITAVVGGKDYADGLKIINELLTNMAVGFNGVGRAISGADVEDAFQGIQRAIKGTASLPEVIELISQIESRAGTAGKAFGQWLPQLKEIAVELAKSAQTTSEITVKESEAVTKYKEQLEVHKQLIRQLDLQDDKQKDALDVIKLQNLGYSESQIALAKLSAKVSNLVDTFNSLNDVAAGITEPLDKQQILTDVLQGNWIKILDVTKENIFTQKEVLKLDEQRNQLSESLLKTGEKLVTSELEMLKIRGASSSELLKAEIAMKTMLYGENAVKNSLTLRLKQEQEITKEKLNQNKLSSDSIKLYRVAQTEGTKVATILAEFLKGNISLGQLQQMPRIFEIAKENFGDLIEQMQAAQFFGLNAQSLGGGRFRGAPGGTIPIPEATTFNAANFLTQMQQLMGAQPVTPSITQTNNVPVNIAIQNLNVAANVDALFEEVKQRIITELDNKQTEISQKIQEQILEE
jgi:TP901 family phage tail tape measure protein